jgi:hypothetical protein
MQTHEKNIEQYLKFGGDKKIAFKYSAPTLENRAKIKYLLFLSNKQEAEGFMQEAGSEKPEVKNVVSLIVRQAHYDKVEDQKPKTEIEKPKFLGFISQYPVELHGTYNDAFSFWLKLCSLKIKLNSISAEDEKSAYEIQTDILENLSKFVQCRKVLDHFNEHKRILPTETKTDFSKFSELELDKKRRNLASLISRRKQTIAKMETDLPEISAENYRKKLASINLKKEQLEELILDEEKILGLMK